MEPDHKEVRTNEEPDAQEYWEAGLMTESLSMLKTGNVDHSQKSCYHCSHKGHLKATGPIQRKLGLPPWTRRPWPRAKETFVGKGHSTRGERGKDPYVKTHSQGRGTKKTE